MAATDLERSSVIAEPDNMEAAGRSVGRVVVPGSDRCRPSNVLQYYEGRLGFGQERERSGNSSCRVVGWIQTVAQLARHGTEEENIPVVILKTEPASKPVTYTVSMYIADRPCALARTQ
jgi:hypothetical protein